MNPVFIENEKLGILDKQIRDILSPTVLKRMRQREFRRLGRLLRDLRLIPRDQVRYLSLAVNGAGEIGLLVLFESPNKEVGVAEPVA